MDDSLAFLDWVRGKDCAVDWRHGKGEPHHLKAVGSGGSHQKPMREHFTVIPLCRDCHREMHGKDRAKFLRDNHFDPWQYNAMLQAEWQWQHRRDPIPVYSEPIQGACGCHGE